MPQWQGLLAKNVFRDRQSAFCGWNKTGQLPHSLELYGRFVAEIMARCQRRTGRPDVRVRVQTASQP
jgi:hypothetical protein